MSSVAIVWFRRDLRLADNPALDHARNHHDRVVGVYIHDVAAEGRWTAGAASRWWLYHSLRSLSSELSKRGGRLLIYSGDTRRRLARLIDDTGARGLYFNRLYEPDLVRQDRKICSWLENRERIEVRSFRAGLLFEPWELTRDNDHPYRVFTPFWNRMQKQWRPVTACPQPRALSVPDKLPEDHGLDRLDLLPEIPWDEGLADTWTPGEKGARRRLERFADQGVGDYARVRDIPGRDGTSCLSPHLHFGEVSPGQVCLALDASGSLPGGRGALAHVRELAWREFSASLLFHFPDTPDKPLNERFASFPWRSGYSRDLAAWKQGLTGIPMVDAGMRQLWHTGWMHNRVRMLVASFLTKNLLIPWQEGARWFWDTLVDADLANNTQGWQWTAGCGADAAPYFRIFNPATQGERFDGQGEYIRRWIPELAGLQEKAIHAPWTARPEVLDQAGIVLGRDYPKPLVDLKASRSRALEAWERIRHAD